MNDRGDYEAALVLYHRASKLEPKEPSHVSGVRETEVALKALSSGKEMRFTRKAPTVTCSKIVEESRKHDDDDDEEEEEEDEY